LSCRCHDNAGRHEPQRRPAFPGWTHKGTEVWRLRWDEVREVYAGFTIGNHTSTHPALKKLAVGADPGARWGDLPELFAGAG
jgi:hypothetical protein